MVQMVQMVQVVLVLLVLLMVLVLLVLLVLMRVIWSYLTVLMWCSMEGPWWQYTWVHFG